MSYPQMMLIGSCFAALSLWSFLRVKKVKAGSVSLPVFALVCAALAVVMGIGNDLS